MNRGSGAEEGEQDPAVQRFNEAPIHESGKWRLRRVYKPDRSASMRPRFMNRGSGQREADPDLAIGASMRPRFMNRGSS